jgi:hypothetical protein
MKEQRKTRNRKPSNNQSTKRDLHHQDISQTNIKTRRRLLVDKVTITHHLTEEYKILRNAMDKKQINLQMRM